jgi:hypothetical protein
MLWCHLIILHTDEAILNYLNFDFLQLIDLSTLTNEAVNIRVTDCGAQQQNGAQKAHGNGSY